MRIENFRMVHEAVIERDRLLRLICQIEDGQGLGVTFNGTSQDEPVVGLVRPIVLGDLRAKLRRCDDDLRVLGVEVDGNGHATCSALRPTT